MKVGDIVRFTEKAFKDGYLRKENYNDDPLVVTHCYIGYCTVSGKWHFNIDNSCIEKTGTARCSFCECELSDFTGVHANRRGTKHCCKRCFDKFYFIETVDNKPYRREKAIRCDDGTLHLKHNCKVYTCALDGNEFFHAGVCRRLHDGSAIEFFHIRNGDVIECQCGLLAWWCGTSQRCRWWLLVRLRAGMCR